MIEPLLTAKQLASLLGCRVNGVYELASRGVLPSYRVDGVGRRFRESEVEAWLAQQREPNQTDPQDGRQRLKEVNPSAAAHR
jgi:excisionase family DNA binding protein